MERAILACSHMNTMDTAISRRYEENKQSYLISDLFLIISFPFNLYFNSYLQFRTNLTMYLLALMIYLVTIVSAKKKARMIFFRQTRIYKILQNIDNIAFKTKRFCSFNCYFKSHAIKIKYIFLLSILIKN